VNKTDHNPGEMEIPIDLPGLAGEGTSDHRGSIDIARVIELARRHRESCRATAEFLRRWENQSRPIQPNRHGRMADY